LQLVPDLPDTQNVYVEFNFAAKLNGSFEEQAAQLQSAVGGPYMTRNEARARLNLPMLDDGNELITPLNVALGAPTPGDPEPPKAGVARMLGELSDWNKATPRPMRVLAKARPPQAHIEKATEALTRFFDRQGAAVLSQLGAEKARGAEKAAVSDVFDTDRWNGELSADLLHLARKTAVAAAKATMRELGLPADDFDPEVMASWLSEHVQAVAAAINATTAGHLAAALDVGTETALADVKALFDTYRTGRAEQIAATLSAAMSGFGTVEAGRHHGGGDAVKTWHTGPHPRPEHAAMDGETVPIDGVFSDGSRWPGGAGNTGLDANCNCDLVVSIPA